MVCSFENLATPAAEQALRGVRTKTRYSGSGLFCYCPRACLQVLWESDYTAFKPQWLCTPERPIPKLRSHFVRHLRWPNLKSETIAFFLSVSPNHDCSHTNHNQNKKSHKNGIKRPLPSRTRSLRGVSIFYPPNLSISNIFWFRLTLRFISFVFGFHCYDIKGRTVQT